MAGTMFVLGILLGLIITFVVVRGSRRRHVDHVFPIALIVAAVVALLSLLTGHGMAALGAAALLAVGEGVGLVGAAVVGPRVMDALEDKR